MKKHHSGNPPFETSTKRHARSDSKRNTKRHAINENLHDPKLFFGMKRKGAPQAKLS